jgi:hypothetical protein
MSGAHFMRVSLGWLIFLGLVTVIIAHTPAAGPIIGPKPAETVALPAETAAPIVPPLASAPPGSDESVATGAATLIAYDQQCGKVPLAFMHMLNEELATVPASVFKAATEKVLASYKSAGPAAWCAVNRRVVEPAMAAFR